LQSSRPRPLTLDSFARSRGSATEANICDHSLAPEVNIARGCLFRCDKDVDVDQIQQLAASISLQRFQTPDIPTAAQIGSDRSLASIVMSVRNVTYDDFDPVIVYSNPGDWSTPNPQASLSPFTNGMKRDSRLVSTLCSSCNRTIPAGSMLRRM
jgi:hypothetical protein